jgi:hypothetical protein
MNGSLLMVTLFHASANTTDEFYRLPVQLADINLELRILRLERCIFDWGRIR